MTAQENLARLIPAPRVSNHVAYWPEDERNFYRSGDWSSLTECNERLDLMRREKVAAAVVAFLTSDEAVERAAMSLWPHITEADLADYRGTLSDVRAAIHAACGVES